MDFEDVLLEVGDNGKYQKKLIVFFLLPTCILLPLLTADLLFMVSVPEHWCHVPEVAVSNLTIEQQRRLVSPPSNPKCLMYEVNYTDYLNSRNYSISENTTTKHCDNGWDYDKTDYESTAATQWNMFCENGHYTSFVLTMALIGRLICTPIYGTMADRIGRKISFFILLTITTISSIASVLMSDFTAFVFLKTISVGVMPCGFQLPYIIVLELVSPELRTHMNGLANSAWSFGGCFLPLIAYLTRNFVTLGLVTSFIAVFFIIYWRFLPESPRWLISRERYDETLVIMQKIAKENGKSFDPDNILPKLKTLGEKTRRDQTVENGGNSFMDLMRYPQLRKMFVIVSICWIADTLSYDGLQLNVTNLAGNQFVNYFLTSIVEIPGYFTSWFLIGRYGRRWCTASFFLMSGTACILPAFVSGLPYADITCSMLGKFFASAAYMATYQQSAELYPTVIRSLSMGMSSNVAAVFTLTIPYIIYLGVYGKSIPFVIFGSSCIIAAISASFLPETLNENLPQTVLDCEEFGKNRKYFSWNRRKKSISRERKASQALQMKEFNKEKKDMKDESIPQNNAFVHDTKNSLVSNAVEKTSNTMTPASEMKATAVSNEYNSQVPLVYRHNSQAHDENAKGNNSEKQSMITSTDSSKPDNSKQEANKIAYEQHVTDDQ